MGWIAAKDDKSGRTYYANLTTGESRWTVPPGFTGRTIDDPRASAATASTASEETTNGASDSSTSKFLAVSNHDASNGDNNNNGHRDYPRRRSRVPEVEEPPTECMWREIEDKNTGKTYYYHMKTRETSWHKPREMIAFEKAQQGQSEESKHPQDDGEDSIDTRRAIAQSIQLQDDLLSDPEPNWESGRSSQHQQQQEQRLLHQRQQYEEEEEEPRGQNPSFSSSSSPAGRLGPNGYDGEITEHQAKANLAPDSSDDEYEEEEDDYDSDDDIALDYSKPDAPEEKHVFGQNKYGVVETFKQKKILTSEEYEHQVEEEMEQLVVEDDYKEDGDYFVSLAITQGDRFKLESYGTTYFNKHKKGRFGSKCTIPEMIAWTNKLIPTSLKKLNSALAVDAKQSFRNITGYMKDRKTSKLPVDHARKLIRQAISSPEELRDEIYCQLCKQTTKNPDSLSLTNGWKLMSLCVAIFPPSEEFACYLSSYFHDASEQPGEIGEFGKYCLKKLDRTMLEGTRRYIPMAMEMEAIEQRKQVSIRVEFLDGTFRAVWVDSQTLVKQVSAQLVKGMDITNEKSFALSEMEDEPPDDPERDQRWLDEMEARKLDLTPGASKPLVKTLRDRFLEKDERILDVLGGWEYKNSHLPKEERKTYRLVFKIRLFHRDEEEKVKSDQARRLYFVQAANDVVQGYYPIEEKDCLELAAIQLQANYGVNELDFYKPNLIIDKIPKYVPKKYRTKRDHTYLENKILTEHEKFVDLTRTEAQIKYLGFVKKYQTYGCTFFVGMKVSRVRRSKDPGEDVVIGISERGLVMLDPVTRNLNHDFTLSEILTYGFKDSNFLLVAGNLMQQKKYNFKSEHGREMHDLLRIYIARLVALQEN